jgi:phospholipid/cholesterol/gamma-HCH transport system substrate-binding protein
VKLTRPIAIGVAILVAIAGVGVYLLARGSSKTMHVTAQFSRVVSVFPGSSVRILGVPVGKVTKITPHGTYVDVEMTYSGKYKVPANATAAVVPPAIVGDRYIQLTPPYTSGSVMKDDATIPIQRTEVPIELDQIFQNLDDLNRALGPQGANAHGALSRLIATGAANLGNGNGKRLHRALHQLSELVTTLDSSKSDLVGVINHLGSFTTTLANDDTNVRKVNDDLATVSEQLANERADLNQAVQNLAVALGEVGKFVKHNRGSLTKNVHGLASVTHVLVKEKEALTEFLDDAPTALLNLQKAFDPNSNSLATRGGFDFQTNPGAEFGKVLCGLLVKQLGSGKIATQCLKLIKLLPKASSKQGSANSTLSPAGATQPATTSNPLAGSPSQLSSATTLAGLLKVRW